MTTIAVVRNRPTTSHVEMSEMGGSGRAGMGRKADWRLLGGRVAIADIGQLPAFPKRMVDRELWMQDGWLSGWRLIGYAVLPVSDRWNGPEGACCF